MNLTKLLNIINITLIVIRKIKELFRDTEKPAEQNDAPLVIPSTQEGENENETTSKNEKSSLKEAIHEYRKNNSLYEYQSEAS